MLSIASLVVPGIGDTMARSTPNNALVILDFPTLGRPTNAIFNRVSSMLLSVLCKGLTTESNKSPVLLPFMAEIPKGSPNPRVKNSNN